jgi:uncharacterized protein YecT (DUF1311 family)
MGSQILLILCGAVATGIVGGAGYLIKRHMNRVKDPVEQFIAHHERLLKAQSSSAVTAPAKATSDVKALVAELGSGEDFTHDMTQAEMNRHSAGMADMGLLGVKHLYDRVVAMLDREQTTAFEESQAAWIRYADLQARLATSQFQGGSIAPTIYNSERARLAQARAADLKRILEWFNQ